MKEQLQQEIESAVKASLAEQVPQGENEARFKRLESSVMELQAQGKQFEGWFSEASKRMERQSLEVGAIQTAVASQQQDITQLQGQVAAQGELVQNSVNQAVITMRADLNTQLSTQLGAQMEQFQEILGKKKRDSRSRS